MLGLTLGSPSEQATSDVGGGGHVCLLGRSPRQSPIRLLQLALHTEHRPKGPNANIRHVGLGIVIAKSRSWVDRCLHLGTWTFRASQYTVGCTPLDLLLEFAPRFDWWRLAGFGKVSRRSHEGLKRCYSWVPVALAQRIAGFQMTLGSGGW